MGYVLSHVGDSQCLPLMEAAVEARTELAPGLPGSRELLYLDLALEDQVGGGLGGWLCASVFTRKSLGLQLRCLQCKCLL